MAILTPKQEAFAQFYVLDGRPGSAYKFAYNCTNMTDESIAVTASRLLQNVNVALRIHELVELRTEAFKISAEKKKAWLEKIVQYSTIVVVNRSGVEKLADSRAAIAAINELNKMDGDLAATRKEITGANGAPIETRTMTPDEYKQARAEMLKADDC